MIKKLSDCLVKWLSKEGAIDETEKPLFSYAAYSLMFGIAPVIITILLGLLLDMLAEGFLMILPFMLIRKFSGGYHLGSAKVCCVLSTTVLLAAFMLIKMFFSFPDSSGLLILVLVATICIALLSPIDSNARKLSPKEIRVFKTIAQLLAVLFCVVYIVLVILDKKNLAIPIGVGLTVVAFLQLPCLLQRTINRFRKKAYSKTNRKSCSK